MMVCPRCERLIRHGERVRVSITADFFREDVDGHRLDSCEEEWVEHVFCVPESRWSRLRKWARRAFRI